MVINNYWRLKFILSWSMREKEIFREIVKQKINMFKEDADRNMVRMIEVIHLSKLPFQCQQGSKNLDCEREEYQQIQC